MVAGEFEEHDADHALRNASAESVTPSGVAPRDVTSYTTPQRAYGARTVRVIVARRAVWRGTSLAIENGWGVK